MLFSLGDTVTAGFLAGDSSPLSTNEYRGFSYVTGNQTDAWTLNNFVTQSAATLTGGSVNLLNGARPAGTYYSSYDGFNGATKGSEDYINGELNFVVNQANNKVGSTNVSSQWKMVTMYLGLFKACTMCQTTQAAYQTNPTFWGSYYYELIENITTTFNQKTMINMVGLPKISQFYSSTASACKSYNQANNICPCLWSQSTSTLDSIITAANTGMKNAISTWKSSVDQTTTTVGITYQPFLVDTVFASTSLSSVDCFHPNVDGQKLMTIGLWNNIRQSTKSTSVTSSTSMVCGSPYAAIYSTTSSY
ncbi:hypothetical protein PPL_09005 [Heterostelium album PN500]|uniref:Uncharacterized protein n=1 Tax=Heterostelium pallidum (strain ATCC 26659 / Pp 5 / PN500) TaxID=670386 RepID=D3BKC4_HETP5|nr:hypothetical protein PPL_09005 [Heterostelium album PN500]EFA78354.1 hypothetical protein PPL_09005 [Heterostelium album PN500]|eukprot:XP_020430479.1 hypothetical protein PPL_09005 [Heterostelium album PN500]